MKYIWLILSLLLGTVRLSAQVKTSLSLSEYLRQVREFHPVLRQADLLPDAARAELTQARGAFDPALTGGFDTKSFDEKEYWNYRNLTLKAPVWSGIEFKAGWENTDGDYLNPESTLPEDGQFFAGVSLPLGRGLVIDERRNAIRVAELAIDISGAERQKISNKVLAEAAKTWWLWWEAANRVDLLEESLELARIRMNGTVQSILNGDKPGIDSVEAEVEVFKREAAWQEGLMELDVARAFASAFLWDADFLPVDLPKGTMPGAPGQIFQSPGEAEAAEIRMWSQENHPEIRKLNFKGMQIDREQAWAKQNLLPDVRLDLLQLHSPGYTPPINTSNYKVGVSFYMPLFLRKERGKLQGLNIKENQNQLGIQDARRNISASLEAAEARIQRLENLVAIQERTVSGTEQLRQAEVTLQQNGESSLFLVNRRERSWVEARLKRVSYEAKAGKARVNYYLESGRDFRELIP